MKKKVNPPIFNDNFSIFVSNSNYAANKIRTGLLKQELLSVIILNNWNNN